MEKGKKQSENIFESFTNIKLSRRSFLKLSVLTGGFVATSGLFFKNAFSEELLALEELKSTADFEQVASGLIPTSCYICQARDPILAEIEKGRVKKTYGNPAVENTYSYGRQCPKGKSGIQQVYSPDRLKYPMRRIGKGKFKRISWQEAFDEIASKLIAIERKYGENAVYVQWSKHPQKAIWESFWKDVYGTKNVFGQEAISDAARRIAWMTSMGDERPLPDYQNNLYTVLFGIDPFGGIRYLWYGEDLMGALSSDSKLIVIDPVFTETAARALEYGGKWIPINPGTDGALALAMAYHILSNESEYAEYLNTDFIKFDGEKFVDGEYAYGFEKYRNYVLGIQDGTKGNDGIAKTPSWAEKITGIPASKIEEIAENLMTNEGAFCDAWFGLSRYSNGTYTIKAIANLCALTGGIDSEGALIRRNGGKLKEIGFSRIPHAKYNTKGHPESLPLACGLTNLCYGGQPGLTLETILNPAFPKQEYEKIRNKGTYPQNWPKEYPIKTIITSFSNVCLDNSNSSKWVEALKKLSNDPEGLLVHIDVFINDTAQYADIILPAADYLETDEVIANDSLFPYVNIYQKVIKPMYETKETWEIAYGLIDALSKKGYKNDSWKRADVAEWRNYLEIIKEQLSIEQADGTRLTWEELKENGLWISEEAIPSYQGYQEGGFKTSKHGKSTKTFDFYSEDLASEGMFSGLPVYLPCKYTKEGKKGPDTEFPFILIGGSRVAQHRYSSTQNLPNLIEMYGENTLKIHPQDASRLWIKNGDYVKVRSPVGKTIRLKAELDEGIKPGIVYSLRGFGHNSKYETTAYKKGTNINQLTDHLNYDPISGSEAQESTVVKISRV
jgi:thiosulfate reductase/polysulfide reductase chain A